MSEQAQERRQRLAARYLPEPLPWGPADERGRHLRNLANEAWAAKVWCWHVKKRRELVAVVLDDGALVVADRGEIEFAKQTRAVTIGCPTCSSLKGDWQLDPALLKARLESGNDLVKVRVDEVAVRLLPTGPDAF